MIDGVELKALLTHGDDRGFFREIIRENDPFFAAGFGQLSHSLVYPGVIKAWHGHRRQHQWTYVASGDLKVVLHDARPESPTFRSSQSFLVGEHQTAAVYCLPPGVMHGYRCLNGPANVIYVTSGTYDLSDEVRLDHDDLDVGYDWSRDMVIR